MSNPKPTNSRQPQESDRKLMESILVRMSLLNCPFFVLTIALDINLGPSWYGNSEIPGPATREFKLGNSMSCRWQNTRPRLGIQQRPTYLFERMTCTSSPRFLMSCRLFREGVWPKYSKDSINEENGSIRPYRPMFLFGSVDPMIRKFSAPPIPEALLTGSSSRRHPCRSKVQAAECR